MPDRLAQRTPRGVTAQNGPVSLKLALTEDDKTVSDRRERRPRKPALRGTATMGDTGARRLGVVLGVRAIAHHRIR